MQSPSRLLLTGSVIGVLVASGTAALTLPGRADEPAVSVPAFDAPVAPQPGASGATITTGPPVTGEQITELAVAPARARVKALLAEKARAEAEAEPEESENNNPSRKLRREIREACEEGSLRGAICNDD